MTALPSEDCGQPTRAALDDVIAGLRRQVNAYRQELAGKDSACRLLLADQEARHDAAMSEVREQHREALAARDEDQAGMLDGMRLKIRPDYVSPRDGKP